MEFGVRSVRKSISVSLALVPLDRSGMKWPSAGRARASVTESHLLDWCLNSTHRQH